MIFIRKKNRFYRLFFFSLRKEIIKFYRKKYKILFLKLFRKLGKIKFCVLFMKRILEFLSVILWSLFSLELGYRSYWIKCYNNIEEDI